MSSARCWSRLGRELSVMGFQQIGSSLSVRSVARLGSSCSVFGVPRFGSGLSVFDFLHLGSALSMRSFARVCSAISVFGLGRFASTLSMLDFSTLGSSMSMRHCSRMGSSISVFGMQRIGSGVSMIDFAHLGSSLSLRSISRFGSAMSVFSLTRFGSSISVLDFVTLGSSLSVRTIQADTMGIGSTYAKFTSATMELYAAGARGMSITPLGGTLHGAWSSEATLTTSDRRLKRSIEPLYRTIAARAAARWNEATGVPAQVGETALRRGSQGGASTAPATAGRQRDPPIGWLLRELRPVSFYLKRGPEAKYLKFGFIAQELENVFPNLVRTTGQDDSKAVASQDLIAVLTLALQTLQQELEDHRRELMEQRRRMERLEQIVYGAERDIV
uniref:Peptidase S74 domain-containing protein n=1 Tax=Alexandrium monilatum TaxID=311494 RepID=A0A7S4QGN8_9DINO